MGKALELVPKLLERDLPVSWDGAPVIWGPPVPVGSVFICPPPKPLPCPGCKRFHLRGADSRIGYVSETLEPREVFNAGTGRGRKYPMGAVRHPKLVLTRCLDCGHDQVYDLDAEELWDLDESDYGPEGSVHPGTLQGELW